MNHRNILLRIALLCATASGLRAQEPSPSATTVVRGRVEIEDAAGSGKRRRGTIPETVVWLTPAVTTEPESEAAATASTSSAGPAHNPQLVQEHKSFAPHILVVPAGSMVEFPNRDPFFHNVFSLFEGKRFDLGLYEAGTSRMVRFDRPGISYIFCNIHPEMNAVVITIPTPLYAVSNADGQLSLPDVPYGRYKLNVWSEGMGPEIAPLTRGITISENASSLGVIRVPEANGQRVTHKNKYGREYDEPTPNNSVYQQQR